MRKFEVFVLLSLSVVMLMTPAIIAQQPQPAAYVAVGSTDGGYYTFAPLTGIDCLWRVGGPDWEQIYNTPQNTFLREQGRRYVREGVTYVLVRPTERIFVPPGVHTRVELEPLPTQAEVQPLPSPLPVQPQPPSRSKLPWVAALAMAMAGLTFLLGRIVIVRRRRAMEKEQRDREREARLADPETSGPPFISGGLDAVPPARRYYVCEKRAQEVLAWATNTLSSIWKVVPPMVKGRLFGIGAVMYNDGASPQEKRFTWEVAYRVTLEHRTSGTNEVCFVLWACANGCFRGRIAGEELQFVEDSDEATDLNSPVVAATAEEVSRFGSTIYNPTRDRMAEVAGHMGTLKGKLVAEVLEGVAKARNGGRPLWHPSPLA